MAPKKKRSKHLKTFSRRDLYDLCMFSNLDDDNNYRPFIIFQEAFHKIRQWLKEHKDDTTRLKEAMTYQDDHRNTPLHIILIRLPPLDIVQTFIQHVPEVLRMQNGGERLPIHMACLHKASLEVVQALYNAYPESVQAESEDGLLIDGAYDYGALLDVLNFIAEAYPEAIDQTYPFTLISRKDDNGMLPLHHACNHRYSDHLIRFLIHKYPKGVAVPDNDANVPAFYIDEKGMSLLHKIATYGKGLSPVILTIFFNANPEVIRLQDKTGLLPLHHAFLNKASSVDSLMSLIKLYPESIAV